jgi:hypothetical protein
MGTLFFWAVARCTGPAPEDLAQSGGLFRRPRQHCCGASLHYEPHKPFLGVLDAASSVPRSMSVLHRAARPDGRRVGTMPCGEAQGGRYAGLGARHRSADHQLAISWRSSSSRHDDLTTPKRTPSRVETVGQLSSSAVTPRPSAGRRSQQHREQRKDQQDVMVRLAAGWVWATLTNKGP